MSEETLTTTEEDGPEIPCMILPMLGHNLLVPTSTVAEMSSVQILESVENTPDWLMGLYPWRGMYVPVISIESINNRPSPPLNPLGRMAVLNCTGVNEKVPFIALPTQGIPRVAKVAEDDISESEDMEKRPFDLMVVKVSMEEFYMPDIVALESAYSEIIEEK